MADPERCRGIAHGSIGVPRRPKLPDLCDASYATLFVLTPGAPGTVAQVIRGQYGAADGPLPASCVGMVAK